MSQICCSQHVATGLTESYAWRQSIKQCLIHANVACTITFPRSGECARRSTHRKQGPACRISYNLICSWCMISMTMGMAMQREDRRLGSLSDVYLIHGF